MTVPQRLYLVDLYDGITQNSFDDADQLVAYLKRKNEAGTLRGEAAYGIFFGTHLSTRRFWASAFEDKPADSQKGSEP